MTLVEVLVALLISLMVFLALMQTALVSIDSNMRNVLRDEAVKVAEMRMNIVRSSLYGAVTSDAGSLASCSSDCPTGFSGTGVCASKDVRNIPNFNFCSNVTCIELGGDGDCSTDDAENKQVNITVGWKWKDEDYTHRISTVKRRI
jgi:type II secretory pathway pseudopilin PulG